jgi:hypothetical protein
MLDQWLRLLQRGAAFDSIALAKCGNSWQAVAMGNKDARGREKKKPKKNKAERVVVSQAPPRIIREAPEKKP